MARRATESRKEFLVARAVLGVNCGDSGRSGGGGGAKVGAGRGGGTTDRRRDPL